MSDNADIWTGLTPPYRTIVADPPWQYNVARGLPTRDYKPSTAEAHYSTLTMEEIAAIPVKDLAAEDAHLYLWVTNPRLFGDRQGGRRATPLDIAEAWGFEYRTMLTWVKTGPLGMGWWFRGNTEHVLFCARPGTPAIPADRREANVVTAPRQHHSGKPAAFFDLVERVSSGPYLELFARSPRLGWDSWGLGFETERTAV